MRYGDVDTITVGSQAGPLSLLQIWVETITQEMTRLSATLFLRPRMTY